MQKKLMNHLNSRGNSFYNDRQVLFDTKNNNKGRNQFKPLHKLPSYESSANQKFIIKRSAAKFSNNVQIPTFGTIDIQKQIKRRHKSKSQSLIKFEVTSKSQLQLLRFMNGENLPKIRIMNSSKHSQVQKLSQLNNNQEKLRKFTQTYFRSLNKTKQQLQNRSVKQQMIPINVFGWKVKGFVIGDNFILKAVKKDNHKDNKYLQKYRKFVYSDQIKNKVKNHYQQFIKNWLYFEGVSNN